MIYALPLLRVSAFRAPQPRARLGWANGAMVLVLAAWAIEVGLYRFDSSINEFGPSLSRSTYAVGFADYLERAGGFAGKLFNDATTGGYLELRFPHLRLYGDSRFMAPARLVDRYLAAPLNLEAMRAIDDEQTFDGYLFSVGPSAEMISRFLRSERFVLAYADLHWAFFIRRGVRMPLAVPHFYLGKDLWSIENRAPALRWAQALSTIPRGELLMARAISDWSASPRVPTPVVGYALNFAGARNDPRLAAMTLAMVPRARDLIPGEIEKLRVVAKYLGERWGLR